MRIAYTLVFICLAGCQKEMPTDTASESIITPSGFSLTLAKKVQPIFHLAPVMAPPQGIIQIELTVLPTGAVSDLHVVRSAGTKFDSVLNRHALEAVAQWRFKPYSPKGRLERLQFPITFKDLRTVECRRIEALVQNELKAGDDSTRAKEFFQNQHWRYFENDSPRELLARIEVTNPKHVVVSVVSVATAIDDMGRIRDVTICESYSK